MKIIRHLTPQGPAHAALQPDGSTRALVGDLFGDWHVTDRVVTPGKLLAPVVPTTIICIGLNYALHAAEGGHATPTYPALFPRFPSSLVAAPPGAPILKNRVMNPGAETRTLYVPGTTPRTR